MPLDGEFFKWLVSLGVGGVIAALIFMFYRKDMRMHADMWRTATDQLLIVVKENTASNIKLITLIEGMTNGRVNKLGGR